jgi:hypothetical protein
MVGLQGLASIEKQLRETFKENLLFLNIEDSGHGEQYCFIKSLIRKRILTIKVELLQNIQLLHSIDVINKIRLVSVADIGMIKLKSASNRKAQKDIYDLDRITDEIGLPELMQQLKIKEEKFHEKSHKCLFDLDAEVNPIDNPLLLLEFDKISYQKVEKRPSHTNDILKINEGHKSWFLARAHWKKKVSYIVKITI